MLPLAFLGVDADVAEILGRMAVAVVLGGIIGLEREFHGRPAGLRTHIMVCLGAAIAVLTTGYLARLSPEMAGVRIDPGRIAAGVLTGIGFIGAGAILRLKNTHRGLTTAACIWFVAALGVVIGVGCYAVGVAGTLLALLVLLGLKHVEKRVHPHVYRELVVVADRAVGLLGHVRAAVEGIGLRVESYDYQDEIDKGQMRVTVSVKYRRRDVGEKLLERLREVQGVRSIGWRFPAAE